jgi:hypothetical protein
MDKSWPTFVHNFNESSQYSLKVFSVLTKPLVSTKFCLIFDQNLSLNANIAVTYIKLNLAKHMVPVLPIEMVSALF